MLVWIRASAKRLNMHLQSKPDRLMRTYGADLDQNGRRRTQHVYCNSLLRAQYARLSMTVCVRKDNKRRNVYLQSKSDSFHRTQYASFNENIGRLYRLVRTTDRPTPISCICNRTLNFNENLGRRSGPERTTEGSQISAITTYVNTTCLLKTQYDSVTMPVCVRTDDGRRNIYLQSKSDSFLRTQYASVMKDGWCKNPNLTV
ncbi:hypothetical protein J6590_098101 [Homalodisca vitripennis]|nr:hypothetical protein J6590_098101 [Homalodisca vitripennis]